MRKIIVTLLLFCNVLAVGLFLGGNEADWLLWLNFLGCMIFGSCVNDYWLSTP